MPRDLFGDVTRPSITIGSRKSYTLPLSLLIQSALVLALVVLPILAPALLPVPVLASIDAPFIPVAPVPPPPPPRARDIARPIASPDAAPLTAPDTIRPETPIDLDWQNAAVVDTPGVIGGTFDPAVIAPPPPPPAAQEPLRVGGTVRAPAKIHDVLPVYPPLALAARVEGIVIIEATIGADGRVVNARVLRSVPLLETAALDAVRQWQFTPTLLNGVPVPVVMTVTVAFRLK